MKRVLGLFAILLVIASFSVVRGAPAQAATDGGTFATGMIIPAGHTATVVTTKLSTDNFLRYGYQLNYRAYVPIGYQTFGGLHKSTPTVTIGPFARPVVLRVYMWDITYNTHQIGGPYYSDGTPVNHALLESPNPYTLHMWDSGASGKFLNKDYDFSGPCNLMMTITIS